MAAPLVPLGISAAIAGALVLFAPRVGQAGQRPGPNPNPNPNPRPGPVHFPAGTPVAIVNVNPNDPGLQGRSPGVRLRSEPTTRGGDGTIVNQGVANGSELAVLSGEVTDEQGRKWRRVQTLQGQVAFAPFVGPDGVMNMRMGPGSPEWPAGGEDRTTPIVVAGMPRLFDAVGACTGLAGCDPASRARRAAYGYGYSGGVWPVPVQFSSIGQMPANAGTQWLASSGTAQCVGRCLVYGLDRGVFTVTKQLPPGTIVNIIPVLPGIPKPGANYVLVRAQDGSGGGWVASNNLQPYRHRPFGKQRFAPVLPLQAAPR